MMRLPFVPGAAEWVYKLGDVKAKLVISDRNSSFIHTYDAHAISREICMGPLKVIKYDFVYDTVILADGKGLENCWVHEIKAKKWGCPVCRAKIDQVIRPYAV